MLEAFRGHTCVSTQIQHLTQTVSKGKDMADNVLFFFLFYSSAVQT